MPKIHYRWNGPTNQVPMLGQILASERGRGAYLITSVDNRGGRTHARSGEIHTLLILTVDRVRREEMLAEGAVVHGLVWDKRVKNTRRLEPAHG